MVKEKKKKPVRKKKKDVNSETLKWVLGITVGLLLLVLAVYFFVQSQLHFNYKGIEFEAVNQGTSDSPLIFYETRTLLPSEGGTGSPFGFRIRTKPSEIKRVPFENLDEFKLMKVNGFSFEGGDFNCEGYGVVAIPNMQRLFEKAGMRLTYDPNATCDLEGRYNYFKIVYGDKTEIKEISPKCYEIVVEGNDEKCEILQATEKLMVEVFVKYRDLI